MSLATTTTIALDQVGGHCRVAGAHSPYRMEEWLLPVSIEPVMVIGIPAAR
jgi:hypothetical protein